MGDSSALSNYSKIKNETLKSKQSKTNMPRQLSGNTLHEINGVDNFARNRKGSYDHQINKSLQLPIDYELSQNSNRIMDSDGNVKDDFVFDHNKNFNQNYDKMRLSQQNGVNKFSNHQIHTVQTSA